MLPVHSKTYRYGRVRFAFAETRRFVGRLTMQESLIHNLAAYGTVREGLDAIEADPGLISARDDRGMAPLHKAAGFSADRLDLVQVLLDHGADPNAKDNDGWTPLDWADLFINRDIIELLATVAEDTLGY